MRDPSTKDGMCIVGDPGEGPGGAAPPYFLTTLRPEAWKKVFFYETGSPPLYLRVWMTGLPRYLKVWIPTGVGVIKPLSQRSSCDVLVPKSVMFRGLKTNHCPRRRGLPRRLLYFLTLCYNVLICRLFIVLSLATDIVSKDIGYLQNRFQEPTVEPETRCACHGELVL